MAELQVDGGNGDTAEGKVAPLPRDAKLLQICAGSDEIQIRAIARALLSG